MWWNFDEKDKKNWESAQLIFKVVLYQLFLVFKSIPVVFDMTSVIVCILVSCAVGWTLVWSIEMVFVASR